MFQVAMAILSPSTYIFSSCDGEFSWNLTTTISDEIYLLGRFSNQNTEKHSLRQLHMIAIDTLNIVIDRARSISKISHVKRTASNQSHNSWTNTAWHFWTLHAACYARLYYRFQNTRITSEMTMRSLTTNIIGVPQMHSAESKCKRNACTGFR